MEDVEKRVAAFEEQAAEAEADLQVSQALVQGTLKEEEKESAFAAKKQEALEQIHELREKGLAYAGKIGALLQEHASLFPAEMSQRYQATVEQFAKCLEQQEFEKKLASSKSMQEALGISDELFQDFYSYAMTLYEKEEFESAQIFLEFLVSLNPFLPSLWHALGLTYQKRGWCMEAISAFIAVTVLDEEAVEARICLLEALIEEGQKEEAKKVLTYLKGRDDLSEWQEYFAQKQREVEA